MTDRDLGRYITQNMLERKIDRGVRGLTVAAMLFTGCSSSEPQPELAVHDEQSGHTLVLPTSKIEFNSNVDILILAEENVDVSQEKEIMQGVIDRIPAAGFLANGGIGLDKDITRARSSMFGLANDDRFNVTLYGIFDPEAPGTFLSGMEDNEFIKNQKELLEWITAHEFGHLFSKKLFPDSEADKLNIVRQTNGNDPLYKTFSTISGWKFFKPGERDPKGADIPAWISDLGRERRSFVNWYNTRNIEETFAEYFAASILRPHLMSEEERRYFSNIHTGLRNDPQRFVEDIRRDPQILLAANN